MKQKITLHLNPEDYAKIKAIADHYFTPAMYQLQQAVRDHIRANAKALTPTKRDESKDIAKGFENA